MNGGWSFVNAHDLQLAVFVMGSTGPLTGYHARTYGIFGGANLLEELAFDGCLDATEDVAAFTPGRLRGIRHLQVE